MTGKKCAMGKKQAEKFQTLKDILCSELQLQYPYFKREFVTCDASSTEISILSQGPLGHDRSVPYASQVLTNAQRNYSRIEMELTPIIWGCKQFTQYIWGRKFTIVTDHKPITWIFKMNCPSFRIMRLKPKPQTFE
jgi:hypothetical protein